MSSQWKGFHKYPFIKHFLSSLIPLPLNISLLLIYFQNHKQKVKKNPNQHNTYVTIVAHISKLHW